MEFVLLLLISGLLYLLPGWLLLAAIRPKGLRSWEWFLLSLAASLVIVPFYFSVLSLILPLQVTVLWLLPLIVLLSVVAALRTRMDSAAGFALRDRHQNPVSRREGWLAVAAVFLFSVLICLPRLNFFLAGSAAMWGGSGDEYWHLSELVAVAFSGLPPHHYFFPDLSLVYYYWSYIYPALIVTIDAVVFSPARVLALHSFVEVLGFTGLAWIVLQRNFASRAARWVGLWSLTIAGGFDFFVTMNLNKYEDWQQQAPWLVSVNQVSSFPTLYLWVTQHVSGAAIFLMGILLWRNMRSSLRMRAVLVAVLLAFGLGTSAFVFLSCCIAGAIWAWLYRRLWWSRKSILPLLLLVGIFLLGAGAQMRMTLGQTGGMAINTLRIPLLEGLMGSSGNPTLISIDRALTLIGFPLSAFWILLVEMGLPFLLYFLWLVSDGLKSRRRWMQFLVAFPVFYVFLTLLITHTGPGHNFVSRGMIPVQIAIVLGACLLLDRMSALRWNRMARIAIVYAMAAGLLAQTITPLFDLRARIMIALSRTLQATGPVQLFHFTIAGPMEPIPPQFQYIFWVNAHTPGNALIVEYSPLADDTSFRLMQRMRFIPPDAAQSLSLLGTDLEEVNASDWEKYRASVTGQDPLTMIRNSPFVVGRQPIVYLVLRAPDQQAPGEIVYSDAFVRILRLTVPTG